MEVKALARNIRVQPRKVRIIADKVRGKNANHAVVLLRYHPSKGARELRKVLMSAIANAQENNRLSPESLRIATIMVDEGPRLKRIQARAMGRANRIVKKSSHITVVVEDVARQAVVKPHGTRAKKRPSFAGAKGRPKKIEQTAFEPVTATKPADEVASTEQVMSPPETLVEEAIGESGADVEDAGGGEPEPAEANPVSESEAPEEEGSAGSAPTLEDDLEKEIESPGDEIEGKEQK